MLVITIINSCIQSYNHECYGSSSTVDASYSAYV